MQEIDSEKAKEINFEQIKAKLQYLKLIQSMIEDLPDLLIEVRENAKITQMQLGYELGVKREQVTADEAEKYEKAALHKLRRTLKATIKLIEKKLKN